MTVLGDHDALLLDLDGTVYEGGRAVVGAVEAITTSGLPALYVTNNASRAPEVVADQLREIGLVDATAENVLTSAQAAVAMAAEHIPQGSKVLVVGTDSFKKLAEDGGFIVVESADDHPVAVFQGHSPETGWPQLTEAALSIRAGAKFFASNLDTTLPTERGLMVGNGSMVAVVVSATGVQPESAGKPGPAMFHVAAEKLGSQRPLAVGDRLDTDIAGGNAAGMDTFQVLTGVSGHYALLNALESQRPTMIADSLADLKAQRKDLIPGPQGEFKARIDGTTLVLDGGAEQSTATQALRTALAVAWAQTTAPVNVEARSDHAKRVLEQWW